MTLTFKHFLIACPLVFLAGYVDALAGGGGLISLPAYLLAGLPTHFAIATNKLSSFMGTSLATYRYARKGYIKGRIMLLFVLFAYLGSTLGASCAVKLNEHTFRIILLVVLPLTAAFVLLKKDALAAKEHYTELKTGLIGSAVALTVGFYDGIYGPGAGTFMILLLTALAHMTLERANGSAKLINLTTNVAALTVYLINGKVLIPLGLAAGAFNMLGAYLGTRSFDKSKAGMAKPVILTVLGIFLIKTVLELTGVWFIWFPPAA